MDEAGIWHGGRPQPRRLCVRWGPSHDPQKGAEPPPQFSGPFLLWPNYWMHQDATWYGGRPWSSPHCARWGHSSSPQNRGQSPQFSAHLYCGRMAGCIKMPLGTDVGLGLRDIVFDMDAATSRKSAHPLPPNFWPMSIVAKWLDE